MIKLKTILEEVLNEMPLITRQGKELYGDDKPLKDLKIQDVSENIVTIVADKDGIFWRKGFFLAYFMDSPESVQAIKNQKIDYLIIHDRPIYNFSFSPITAVWNKNTPQQKHILGMLQGWIMDDKKEIYVDKASVRPGFKRNSIATKLLKTLESNHPGYIINFSGPTKNGAAFIKKVTGQPWKAAHGETPEY
jgi:hypothetical protein